MLISAFVFRGRLYVSPALLREYRDTPLDLFHEGKIDQLQFKALITGIAALVTKAKLINPQKRFVGTNIVQ